MMNKKLVGHLEKMELESQGMDSIRPIQAVKTIGIVSLSRGILGEDFIKHELDLGVKRLEDYGIKVVFLPHALKGLDYLETHPEDRAADLLHAFRDPDIDMILCAIGGDDTYRLLPYLFDNDELKQAVYKKDYNKYDHSSRKIFLGFSDTTINHLMLHKIGFQTFYGQSFLSDVCELGRTMLPYTQTYFEELIYTGTIKEIVPSKVWYENRTNFHEDQGGKDLMSHPNGGFEHLQGNPVFSGKILGGCIDTMFGLFDGERHGDMPVLNKKYALFPSVEDWKGRILLLETSENKMDPEKYRKAIEILKEQGIFDVISGLLVGKPYDQVYQNEYHEILLKTIGNPNVPVVGNINIGHGLPRCILPFGVDAVVNAKKQRITFATAEDFH